MDKEKQLRSVSNFGDNLYNIRTKLGITREELADKIHVSSARLIYAYENGEKCPSLQTLILICEKLNVSMDSLFQKK